MIFAANHQSHFDVPRFCWACRTAGGGGWPLRWPGFFDAHFFPSRHSIVDRLTIGALFYLAVLFFNTFPFPRTGPGARATLNREAIIPTPC